MSEYMVKLTKDEVKGIGEKRWHKTHRKVVVIWGVCLLVVLAVLTVLIFLLLPAGWIIWVGIGAIGCGSISLFGYILVGSGRASDKLLNEAEKVNGNPQAV